MNLINDQKGIWDRFVRESGGWTSHLENSKKAITKFCEGKKGTVCILGSGWLLDIPIDILAKSFDKVYLLDLYQPPQIIHQVKNYDNVYCIETDITGGLIREVYLASKKWKKNRLTPDLSTIEIKKFYFNKHVDYFISVNILSQLGALLIEYLEKLHTLNNQDVISFKNEIQKVHLHMLKFKPSFIISDFEEWLFDTKTNQISTNRLVQSKIISNENSTYWDWLFDMTGKYYKDKKTILKVIATEL